jgi:hypothetical protein
MAENTPRYARFSDAIRRGFCRRIVGLDESGVPLQTID